MHCVSHHEIIGRVVSPALDLDSFYRVASSYLTIFFCHKQHWLIVKNRHSELSLINEVFLPYQLRAAMTYGCTDARRV